LLSVQESLSSPAGVQLAKPPSLVGPPRLTPRRESLLIGAGANPGDQPARLPKLA
jgi:hypothetical protein